MSLGNTLDQTAKMMGRSHDIRFDRLMPGYHDRIRANASDTSSKVVSSNFSTIVVKLTIAMALMAMVIFSAASFYSNFITKGISSTSENIRQIVIGDDVISIPENMIRFHSQRQSHNLNRLDLFVDWPSMKGYQAETAGIFDSMEAGSPILFVSLEPRDMTKDMSGRIDSIYEKFFSGPPIDAGNGLVRQPFAADSAYFSEDLFYEANSPYPYAARCVRDNKQIADPFCIRDIHIGRDLMLTYRFHIKYLPDWLSMDRAVRETFGVMIAK